MTKDEVLKLALDALENSVDYVAEEANNAERLYGQYPPRRAKINGLKVLADKHEEAITAIQQALAQPAQPEQKPVAWMTINEYGEEDDIHYENPEGHLLDGWTYRPLYTHPPSVPPVKLRRGDILRCIETDELCTVWSTSITGKTLVKWSANNFGDYTAEQIGELFWLEPKPEQEPVQPEQKPVSFPSRRAVERAIESVENPKGLLLNDGKERVILPGGTLRYMLALIDQHHCVVCGKFLPADEYGVIVHDDVPHPVDMDFQTRRSRNDPAS